MGQDTPEQARLRAAVEAMQRGVNAGRYVLPETKELLSAAEAMLPKREAWADFSACSVVVDDDEQTPRVALLSDGRVQGSAEKGKGMSVKPYTDEDIDNIAELRDTLTGVEERMLVTIRALQAERDGEIAKLKHAAAESTSDRERGLIAGMLDGVDELKSEAVRLSDLLDDSDKTIKRLLCEKTEIQHELDAAKARIAELEDGK